MPVHQNEFEMVAFAHHMHTCTKVYNRRAVLLVCAPDAQLAIGVVAPALNSAFGYHSTRVSVAQVDGRCRNT